MFIKDNGKWSVISKSDFHVSPKDTMFYNRNSFAGF